MSGRPAIVRARDLKQAIIAARNAGSKKVEVKMPGEIAVIVHLDVEDDEPAAPDSNNSFDKIMRGK